MGVVYGAGSLWQWKLHPAEIRARRSFPGRRVWLHERHWILRDRAMSASFPKYWTGCRSQTWPRIQAGDNRPLVPGKLFVGYAAEGGPLKIWSDAVPLPYRVLIPRSGELVREECRGSTNEPIPDEGGPPHVYVCYEY